MSTAATRTDPLYESVRATVETAIRDVVGELYYEECEVGLDSTFAEDIQLESMEVMEIAERLIEHYDGKVDFIAWFADFELDDLIALTVGRVIDFIVATLEAEAPAHGAQPASERVGG